MPYLIKNMSRNRPLVCTLGDGTTLRLFPLKEVTLNSKQYTKYFEQLSTKKLVTVTEVQTKKSTVSKKLKTTVEKTNEEET